jgi:16S rRNA (guanine1207-N2)-methyltransferase
MDHYYTPNPNTPHNIEKIFYSVREEKFQFMTDSGVFSKHKVDHGSDIMIRTLPALKGEILDLGCGYGAIGIAVARLNPYANVTMVDINMRAVELTRTNITLNQVTNAVAMESDGFANVDGKFNTIVSNPPIRTGKKVIYPLFEESIRYLVPGGALYLVIQKKQGAKSAMDKLESIYGNCQAVKKESGYWILKSERRD